MKCLFLFSKKSRKKYQMTSAEFAQTVVMVNSCILTSINSLCFVEKKKKKKKSRSSLCTHIFLIRDYQYI